MELPDLHVRITTSRSPRLSIVDVFVLTASCAGGMMVANWLSNQSASRLDASLSTLFFAVILPCACGVLLIGHPAVTAQHIVSGRRLAPLTRGEILGVVPGLSVAALMIAALVTTMINRDTSTGRWLEAVLMAVVASIMLLNAVVPILAFGYLCDRIKEGSPAAWTDVLGVAAALVPGTTVLLVFVFLLALS